MRNLHLHIKTEYGEESKEIFYQWERTELKMANFQNHRWFTLRYLSEKVTPVSIKLKSHIKTPKGLQIIRIAERFLLNERVRMINITINMMNMFTTVNLLWQMLLRHLWQMELLLVIILCLFVWLMLSPCVSVVDVINQKLMHCFGRCY